jgi:putative membrane protein
MSEVMVAGGWIGGLILLPWLLIGLAGAHLPDSLAVLRNAPWELWRLTPVVSVPLFVIGCLYVRGLRGLEAAGMRPSAWQQVSFFAALAAIFAALQSPIEALADHSLAMDMVAHMLLRSTAPALLMLAQPRAVLVRGLPSGFRRRIIAPLANNRGARALVGLLSHPLPATVLFVGVLYVWMLPRWQDLALSDGGVRDLMNVTLLLSGVIFFWCLFDMRAASGGPTIGTRLLMIWGAELANVLIGYYLTYASHPIYPAYAQLGLVWGISPLANQNYGGQTLWVCDTMTIAFAAMLVIYLWSRDEGRFRAHAHDAVRASLDLDAHFARQRAGNRRVALALLGFVGMIVAVMSLSVGFYVVHYRRAERRPAPISLNQIP